ncbi:MAG TPA: BON domain-containing protein [Thermomicrobiales bacterium]|jgi:osmotically-inducible protein OsmY|nr:BON domain-containing protein [Thermomicrobiales bacterium]
MAFRSGDGDRRSDGDIKDDVMQTIRADAEINSDHVVINVTNGIVTLTGRVGSWIQQQRAEEHALRIPGVVEVDNDLQANG